MFLRMVTDRRYWRKRNCSALASAPAAGGSRGRARLVATTRRRSSAYASGDGWVERQSADVFADRP